MCHRKKRECTFSAGARLEVVIRQEVREKATPQLRTIAQHREDKGIEDMAAQRGVLNALLVADPNHTKQRLTARIDQPARRRAHALAVVKHNAQVGVAASSGDEEPHTGTR